MTIQTQASPAPIQLLRDDLPVSSQDLAGLLPASGGEIDLMLASNGADPVGRRGTAPLWRADDALRFVFHVDPAEWRQRCRTGESAA